jgi:hypothetical protein
MTKILFAAAAALMIAPVLGGTTPAKAGDGMRMAQVVIDTDRDRDRYHRGDRDVTVGVGPGGVYVGGRRDHCRTVTTWVDRDDGRRIKRTERRCD